MATVNNNKLGVHVVVAWLWCSVVGASIHAQDGNAAALRYEKVKFKVTSATTADDYTKFIRDLRNQVLSEGVLNNGIPVLRDRLTTLVSHPQRFILVELSNEREDTITLAIDVTNMYLVGYEAAGRSYFFRDAPEYSGLYLFNDSPQQTFAFSSRYDALANQPGGGQRDTIALGGEAFSASISNLRYSTSIGRAFIVVVQMITEAVRFRAIETRVRNAFANGESFTPDTYMVALENSWDHHCTQVQQSTEGVFQRPVSVQIAPGDHYVAYDNVRQVIANLALMFFVCRTIGEYPMHIIRPVVAKTDLVRIEICTVSEPTVLIIGRDGLCVDVRDGDYNDGNPVQLWPCHGGINQLWKIARDGTLRSNGKCLTTNPYPGGYVMIYDCAAAVDVGAVTKWEIWGNGTIINPQSGLVLNAWGWKKSTLVVDPNTYASRQCWLPTRDTNPLIVSIIGFRNLCMQANGAAMWLETCVSGKAEQKWALYPDGTIRPTQSRDECLEFDSDSSSTVITIGSCRFGFSSQRWVFTNEGTILNLSTELVMDVKQSDPSLHQIIISPYTGNPNQLWVLQPASE